LPTHERSLDQFFRIWPSSCHGPFNCVFDSAASCVIQVAYNTFVNIFSLRTAALLANSATVCPAPPTYGPVPGAISQKTGAVGKVTVIGPVIPKGMLFLA